MRFYPQGQATSWKGDPEYHGRFVPFVTLVLSYHDLEEHKIPYSQDAKIVDLVGWYARIEDVEGQNNPNCDMRSFYHGEWIGPHDSVYAALRDLIDKSGMYSLRPTRHE